MWFFRSFALLAVLTLLASCGFRPLYESSRQQGAPAELATIDVDPIQDRMGQQLRNHLFSLLTPQGRPSKPRYVLHVTLSESIQQLAVKKTSFATRANLRLQATFSLREIGADKDQKPFIGTTSMLSSYNILDSEYATIIAKRDARTRAVREISGNIKNRLAVYFKRQKHARKASNN